MTKDLTNGPPLRLILAFAAPLALGSLFQQFYSLADTVIVGRFLGVGALAAVGSTGSLHYMVLGFVMGLCNGFAIPMARAFGAKDEAALRRAVAGSVWLCAGFGLALTVCTVALTRPILLLMQTPADILDGAAAYIGMMFAGIPAIFLYNMVSALMRALGDSKTPLYFLLLSSVLNIGLDLALILLLNAGVFGAALATVASQLVSGLLSLWVLVRRFKLCLPRRGEWAPAARPALELCRAGVPMGLQCSITAIGSVVLQGAVNGLGSVTVAAVTAASKASMLLSVPLESIGTAMATYAGQNLGALRLDRVRQGVRCSLAVGAAYSAASFAVFRLAGQWVLLLFMDAGETAVLAQAQLVLFWYSAFYLMLSTLIVFRYTLQGLGCSALAMMAGAAEMAARALVAFWLVPRFGILGAAFSNPAAWAAACLYLAPVYFIELPRLQNRINTEVLSRRSSIAAAAGPQAQKRPSRRTAG